MTITELFAFVAVDADGDEGIMGMRTSDGWMPLIGADVARVESLRPLADEISMLSGKPYELRYFKLASHSTKQPHHVTPNN